MPLVRRCALGRADLLDHLIGDLPRGQSERGGIGPDVVPKMAKGAKDVIEEELLVGPSEDADGGSVRLRAGSSVTTGAGPAFVGGDVVIEAGDGTGRNTGRPTSGAGGAVRIAGGAASAGSAGAASMPRRVQKPPGRKPKCSTWIVVM